MKLLRRDWLCPPGAASVWHVGDRLVRFDPVDGHVIPLQVDTSTLVLMALTLLEQVSCGVSDFARTYTTDSLSQKVSYDLRNLLYDKLQHLALPSMTVSIPAT